MTTQNNTPASNNVTWSDEMGSRSRRAWLLLVKGEKIVSFTGSNIPGIVVIRGTDYHKNGKWSHTTYRLDLAAGVRAISGRDGWETGKFVEGLRSAVGFGQPIDTWADVANALGVSVPSAMEFLKEWRPKAATTLDEVDAQLSALDEAVDPTAPVVDTETVVVSFGGPTNRAIADGFWKSPKSITGHNGELRLIDVTKEWTKDNIRVARMIGTVLSATHASGYHGGYVSVTVAVVPGSTVVEADEPKQEVAAPVEETPLVINEPTPEPEPATPATMADLMAKFGRK